MPLQSYHRVGRRSHTVEVIFGYRTCDGDAISYKCKQDVDAGAWGPAVVTTDQNKVGTECQASKKDVQITHQSIQASRIPNKHVLVANNLIFNPTGYQSQWQQISVDGAGLSQVSLGSREYE